MMLEFLGNGDANYQAAHDLIVEGIEAVLADKNGPKTPDLGGKANTSDLGDAVVDYIKSH